MRASLQPNPKALRYRMAFPADNPEAFIAYAAMLQPLFETTRTSDAQPFESIIDTTVLDGIFLTRQSCSGPLLMRRTHETIARSGIDAVIITTYQTGVHDLEIDGVKQTVQAEEIVILDAARPATVRVGAFSSLSLTVGREAFENRFPRLDDAHGCIIHTGGVQRVAYEHLLALSRQSERLLQSDCAGVSDASLAVLTTCMNHVVHNRDHSGGSNVSLSTIRTTIDKRLGQVNLGPSTLMQQFGLSRPTLYRLFEPVGGVTAYINERRLRRAFRILTTATATEPSVAKLARNVGFASATAFGRAFRRKFDMTPRDASALAWRPLDPTDSPWRIPKITESFVTPLDSDQKSVDQYIDDR